MREVIVSRLIRLVATILVVTFLSFVISTFLPGDQVSAILGLNERTPEIEAQIREEYHLDDPIIVQYVYWLKAAVLEQDLGPSIPGIPVATDIKNRIPITAELTLVAVGLALIVAVPLGVLGAYREGKAVDKVTSAFAQLFLSIPNYVLAIFLGYFISVKLGWLPNSSWVRISDSLTGNLKTVALPAISLAMAEIAVFSRLVRSDMIGTLRENFVLSARAKGLTNRYILFRHALRNSSLSLITVVGLTIGGLLGGTVIIEQIFALPGLGKRMLDAISQRDVYMVQGIVVFISVVYVVLNFLVDMIYLYVDPRIRSKKG